MEVYIGSRLDVISAMKGFTYQEIKEYLNRSKVIPKPMIPVKPPMKSDGKEASTGAKTPLGSKKIKNSVEPSALKVSCSRDNKENIIPKSKRPELPEQFLGPLKCSHCVDSRKMCSSAQNELRSAKTELLELRNKVQTTEKLEQKVKDLEREKKELKEAKDLEIRKMRTSHVEVLKYKDAKIEEWKRKAEAVLDTHKLMEEAEQKDNEIEELKRQLSVRTKQLQDHLSSKKEAVLKQKVKRLTQELKMVKLAEQEFTEVESFMKRQMLEIAKLKEENAKLKLSMTEPPAQLKELMKTLGIVEIQNELNEQAVCRLVEEVSSLKVKKESD